MADIGSSEGIPACFKTYVNKFLVANARIYWRYPTVAVGAVPRTGISVLPSIVWLDQRATVVDIEDGASNDGEGG